MTSAGGPSDGDDARPVDLSKGDDPSEGGDAAPFDPYRFGRPDTPPPPEYAPPGYVPDPPAQPSSPPLGGVYPPMPGGPSQSAPPSVGYPPQPPYGQAPYAQHPYQPQPYGQPPYGASGYGAPGYPGYGTPQGPQSNGKAIAGMVLGIASIVFCWLTFFDLLLIVPALVFSLIGLSAAKQRGSGKGQAIAGLICTVVAVVFVVIVLIVAIHIFHDCTGINHNSSAYDRCLRNNV